MGRSAGSLREMSVSSISTGDASHLDLPHPGVDHPPGEVDGHREHPPRRRLDRQDRQAGEVVVGIDVLLEAVGVHRLTEVAGAVEQPHPDEGDPEVARRLAVVPGEHSEATGVDPQGLVDPELHREVGDGPAHLGGVLLEPGRLGPVLVEGGDRLVVEPHELGVREQPHPLLGLHVDQELHRVVVAPPGHGVDPPEQALGDGRPAPPVVVGEVPETLERRRQLDVGGGQRADVRRSGSSGSYGLFWERAPQAEKVEWLEGDYSPPAGLVGRGLHEPLDPDPAVPFHRGELDPDAARGLEAHHRPGAPDRPAFPAGRRPAAGRRPTSRGKVVWRSSP